MDELLTIEPASLSHPDVVAMIDEVQLEYVRRYGGPDETPLLAEEFAQPTGLLLVARVGGDAVGMGGWRAHDASTPGLRDGDAEIKRMYVRPNAQRRGVARRLLAEIEASARTAGRRRLVLETGTRQPEAVALYRSDGFAVMVPKFGLYRGEESSICMVKDLGTDIGAGVVSERAQS